MKLTTKREKIEKGHEQDAVRVDRSSYIGGSDAGAVLGLNPYKSKYRLWSEKVGLVSDEVPDNDAMRTGRDLEEYVASRFEEKTGKKVRRSNYKYSLKEYPFIVAHVDRMVVGEDAILECKTANSFQAKKYASGEFPNQYYAQCVHYMAVTGAKKCYLAVLCFPHFYTFEIERDEKEVEALIREEVLFWNLIQKQQPPELDGSESTVEALIEAYPEAERGSDTFAMLTDFSKTKLNDYLRMKENIAQLNELCKSYENEIKEMLKTYELGLLGDGYIASWKNVTTNRLDTTRLKKERPDIYDHYLKESVSRRFEIKKPKKEIENKEEF